MDVDSDDSDDSDEESDEETPQKVERYFVYLTSSLFTLLSK